jgi:hypothetical protein
MDYSLSASMMIANPIIFQTFLFSLLFLVLHACPDEMFPGAKRKLLETTGQGSRAAVLYEVIYTQYFGSTKGGAALFCNIGLCFCRFSGALTLR